MEHDAAGSILSQNQKKILAFLARGSYVREHFYLTGGTALAEYYLHHRLSEDLDFFSLDEVDAQGVFSLLKGLQADAGIISIDSEQSFNRNLFFLKLKDGDVIKTEFTYFPFPQVEIPQEQEGVPVDSVRDIAVNKLFTIYQKPRSRDFIDLYCIIQKTGWTLGDLQKQARIKFDWHIDPIQLGAQFLQAAVLKDYPRMLISFDEKKWQNFFIEAARAMKTDVMKE